MFQFKHCIKYVHDQMTRGSPEIMNTMLRIIFANVHRNIVKPIKMFEIKINKSTTETESRSES